MKKTKNIRCLLLTPFSGNFQNLRKVIANALREIGVEPILLEEEMAPGTSVIEAVQQAIERADVIIVDLTDSNPNVMYETGYAHALKKPVLPIVQSSVGRVPSDIAGYLYLVYESSQPEELQQKIKNWVTRHTFHTFEYMYPISSD